MAWRFGKGILVGDLKFVMSVCICVILAFPTFKKSSFCSYFLLLKARREVPLRYLNQSGGFSGNPTNSCKTKERSMDGNS